MFFLDPAEGCGSRGVIGTAARVPDYFAAEFSERFYRYLLSGELLGHAMHKTKWDLLTMPDQNNPLGLLYLLYADPNIRVRIANPAIGPKPIGRRRK